MKETEEAMDKRFHDGDRPDLAEEGCHITEQQRPERERDKEENLRWLEEHMGFRPFGVEW